MTCLQARRVVGSLKDHVGLAFLPCNLPDIPLQPFLFFLFVQAFRRSGVSMPTNAVSVQLRIDNDTHVAVTISLPPIPCATCGTIKHPELAICPLLTQGYTVRTADFWGKCAGCKEQIVGLRQNGPFRPGNMPPYRSAEERESLPASRICKNHHTWQCLNCVVDALVPPSEEKLQSAHQEKLKIISQMPDTQARKMLEMIYHNPDKDIVVHGVSLL